MMIAKEIQIDAKKLTFKQWKYKYRLQLIGFNPYGLFVELNKPVKKIARKRTKKK